jgi:hypothetical protein
MSRFVLTEIIERRELVLQNTGLTEVDIQKAETLLEDMGYPEARDDSPPPVTPQTPGAEASAGGLPDGVYLRITPPGMNSYVVGNVFKIDGNILLNQWSVEYSYTVSDDEIFMIRLDSGETSSFNYWIDGDTIAIGGIAYRLDTNDGNAGIDDSPRHEELPHESPPSLDSLTVERVVDLGGGHVDDDFLLELIRGGVLPQNMTKLKFTNGMIHEMSRLSEFTELRVLEFENVGISRTEAFYELRQLRTVIIKDIWWDVTSLDFGMFGLALPNCEIIDG